MFRNTVLSFFVSLPAFSMCTLSPDGANLFCPEGVYQLASDGTYWAAGTGPGATNRSPAGLGPMGSLGPMGPAGPSGHVSPSTAQPLSPSSGFSPSSPRAVTTSPAASGPPAYRGPAASANNPGRGYEMFGSDGKKKLSSCQHTLFERKGSTCFSLTASHCFQSVLSSLALEMAESSCNKGLPTTKGDVVTLDFKLNSQSTGMVPAKAHLNKRYFSGDTSDVAVIEWECRSQPAQPMLPLCTSPARDGEQVSYGKVMGQAGLYSGVVKLKTHFRTPEGHPAFRMANAGTLDVQQFGPKTQNGDSGGPLIKRSENCLLAALSGEAFHQEGSVAQYGVGAAGGQSTTAGAFAARVTGDRFDDIATHLVSR